MDTSMDDAIRESGNPVPSNLNGVEGPEGGTDASRVTTTKPTPNEYFSKSVLKNGNSKPNSRASTPKSTQSERKGASKNGISKPNSRASTPKSTQSERSGALKRVTKKGGSKSLPGSRQSTPRPQRPSRHSTAAAPQSVQRTQPIEDYPSNLPAATEGHVSSNTLLSPHNQPSPVNHSISNVPSPTTGPAEDNTPKELPPVTHLSEESQPLNGPSSNAQSPSGMSSSRELPSETGSAAKRQSTPRGHAGSRGKSTSKDPSASKRRSIVKAKPSKPHATPRLYALSNAVAQTPDSQMSGANYTFSTKSSQPSSRATSTSRRKPRKSADKRSSNIGTPNLETPDQPTGFYFTHPNDIDTPALSTPGSGAENLESTGKRRSRRQPARASTTFNNSPALTDGDVPMADSEDYFFEFDSEMYGSRFGLDGAVDRPQSAASGSNSTTNTRTSGRARKPSARALESMASEKRNKRKRAPTKPTETRSSKRIKSGTQHENHQAQQVPTGNALFDLAAAAVSPFFLPIADADDIVKTLRQEFETEQKAKEKNGPAIDTLIEYENLSPTWQPYWPNNTYNDNEIPKPPLRLRSSDQEEKDRIFGYPPVLGNRNVFQLKTTFCPEDIDLQLDRIRAREAARDRGIMIEPWVPTERIQSLIKQHDENLNNDSIPQGSKQRKGKKKNAPKPTASAPATPGPSRKKRRNGPVEDATMSDARQGEEKGREAGAEKSDSKKDQNKAPAQENVAPPKAPRLRLIFREA